MSHIVLQITQEWHEPHVKHESGTGRVPVIRRKGETITDPDDVKRVLAERPHFVIKRAASPDEESAIERLLAARAKPSDGGA